LLDNGTDLVTVSGDGGAGKSRLLIAAGQKLAQRDNKDVYYVTDSLNPRALPNDRDTVLFVDDAGRNDMEHFLRKSVPDERIKSNRDQTVQVVAANRPVYDEYLKRTVAGIRTTSTATLRLNTLDEPDIGKLISQYNLQDEVVEQITTRSNGNPFFALLLGEIATEEGEDRLTIKNALASVVGEMASAESDLEKITQVNSAEAVERWLEALALWESYTEPDDGDLIERQVPEFSSPIARRQQLDSLADSGYLNRTNTPKPSQFEYSHRYDIVADYLRFEIIESDQYYPYMSEKVLCKKAPSIAQGVADLQSSPLAQLYADADNRIDQLVNWIAEEILEISLPLHKIVEAEAHLVRVSPEYVPSNEILTRIDPDNYSSDLGDSMAQFAGATLEQLENTESVDQAHKWLMYVNKVYNEDCIDAQKYAKVLDHAIRQYGNIGALQEFSEAVDLLDDIQTSIASDEISVGLANAASIYSIYKKFSELEEVLNKLRDLNNEYQTPTIQTSLATGLINAVASYGEKKRFEKFENALSELRELYVECPAVVRKQYTVGLANAIADYGDERSFDDVEEILSELRDIHSENPAANIREDLSVGLFNAVTSYGQEKEFAKMEERLSELRRLNETYQEATIREEFADALSEAVAHYRDGSKQLDKIVNVVSQLIDLHGVFPDTTIRNHLAKSLGYAAQLSIKENRTDKLIEYVEELIFIVEEYGDLGGFEEKEWFLPAYKNLILKLLQHDPETAIEAIDIVEQISDENSLLRFQVEVEKAAYGMYRKEVITGDVYNDILDKI
jgi:hypothetical protein